MQDQNLIVFLLAPEVSFPFLSSSHSVSVGGRLHMSRYGWAPMGLLCLFLNSSCFFKQVLFDFTRVSGSLKLWATLLLRAVTGQLLAW